MYPYIMFPYPSSVPLSHLKNVIKSHYIKYHPKRMMLCYLQRMKKIVTSPSNRSISAATATVTDKHKSMSSSSSEPHKYHFLLQHHSLHNQHQHQHVAKCIFGERGWCTFHEYQVLILYCERYQSEYNLFTVHVLHHVHRRYAILSFMSCVIK